MGFSATGILAYGVRIGDEEDFPQWMYSDPDEYERHEDVDEALILALGGPRVDWEAEDYKAQRQAQRDFSDSVKVSVVSLGHHEYPYFVLAVSESVTRGRDWSGRVVDLDTLAGCAHSGNYDYHLDNALRVLGMDVDTERGWILAASYG